MKIQLEAHEALSIAELLISDKLDAREIKYEWAVKLIKATLPGPAAPTE